ncbi:MAG: tetratricopeptide repeat protein [Minicystis sp.]
METLFSWIHLADLHFAAVAGPRDRMLGRLRDDLAEHRELRAPDVLVVTGDVATTGASAEYARAGTWLREAGGSLGLGPARIFVVPGNHDLDRTPDKGKAYGQLRNDIVQGNKGLDAALASTTERVLLVRKLQAYLDFAAGFAPACLTATGSTSMLDWSHRIQGKGGLVVRLIGLHSMLLSAGDADRGALRLGTAQLERGQAAIHRGELAMVAAHHPIEGGWLADEAAAKAWMAEHAQIFLSAQVHDDAAEDARKGRGTAPIWISSGATAQGKGTRGARRFAYSFGAVLRDDEGAIKVRIWPRSWAADKRQFTTSQRLVPEGQSYVEHPLSFAVQPDLVVPEAAWRAMGRAASVHQMKPQRAPGEPGTPGTPGTIPPPAPPPPSVIPPPLPPAALTPPAIPPPSVRAPPPIPRPSMTFPAVLNTGGPSSAFPNAVKAPTVPPPPTAPKLPTIPPPSSPTVTTATTTAASPGLSIEVDSSLFEGPGGLPAHPIHYFVGRTLELTTLREGLTRDPSVTCVVATGLGGVGKTSLVHHFVATEAKELFEEAAWVDARDLWNDLGRVARRFGWKDGDRAPSVEEATRFLTTALFERSVLLVIDNVDLGVIDVRKIPIPGGRCRTVITSRSFTMHEDLSRPARAIRLGCWDLDTCRAHLRQVVPGLSTTPDADLDQLSRKVGGLPLAMRLIAKLLLRPDASVPRLLARMEKEPLGTLDAAAKGSDRSIAATFLASVRSLPEIERRVLTALAATAPSTNTAVVSAVVGFDEDSVSRALEELADQSLIDWMQSADRPFRLHDVVALLLRSQPGVVEAEAAHNAFVHRYIEAHKDPSDWEALDHEMPEILTAVERALRNGSARGAFRVLSAVADHLDRRGRLGDLIERYLRLLEALPDSSEERAGILTSLGHCYGVRGDLDKALEHFERALGMSDALDFAEGQASAYGGLGHVHGLLNDLGKSIACYQRSREIFEALGDRPQEAAALGNVGIAYRKYGELSRAIDYLEQALAIQEELGLLEGQASTLLGLGLCLRDIGEIKSALEYFEQALKLEEMLGNRRGQAIALGNIGNTQRTDEQLDKAIATLKRALALYEELQMLGGQAAALGNLGSCYRTAGDYDAAIDHLQRALSLHRQVGLPNDHPTVLRIRSLLSRSGPLALDEIPRTSTL